MRVLLDEHLPRKLANELTGHAARTVREMGWGALQNGALLRQAADDGFDAMITMDRGIRNQQNLARIRLGIVVVRATDSRLASLRPLVSDLLRALETIQPGEVAEIGL